MEQLIIVGIRKITPYLAEELAQKGFKVTIIELDKQKCQNNLANQAFRVINGDGADRLILEVAGIKKCNTLLALTGSDDTNLIICKKAVTDYHVARTLAWLNNPHNEDRFTTLGIHCYFNVVDKIIADLDSSVPGHDVETFIRTANVVELTRKIYRKVNIFKSTLNLEKKHDERIKGKIEGYEETANMLESLLNVRVFIKKE